MAAVSPFVSTFQTTSAFVYQGAAFASAGENFVVSVAPATAPGLIGALNVSQQLELIYLGYFNRAADGNGFTFWQESEHAGSKWRTERIGGADQYRQRVHAAVGNSGALPVSGQRRRPT